MRREDARVLNLPEWGLAGCGSMNPAARDSTSFIERRYDHTQDSYVGYESTAFMTKSSVTKTGFLTPQPSGHHRPMFASLADSRSPPLANSRPLPDTYAVTMGVEIEPPLSQEAHQCDSSPVRHAQRQVGWC